MLTAALISLVNCSSATRTTTENVNANLQKNSNTTATAAPTSAAENQADNLAPDALVKDLYNRHDAEKSPFFQTEDRALVDKYFDKALADLIWKDAIVSKGEVGALDSDPLYNAQDTEIKNFSVGQPQVTGDKAEVAASFENFKKKETITFMLVKQNGDWKIFDINYGGGDTLLGIFKQNAEAMSNTKK